MCQKYLVFQMKLNLNSDHYKQACLEYSKATQLRKLLCVGCLHMLQGPHLWLCPRMPAVGPNHKCSHQLASHLGLCHCLWYVPGTLVSLLLTLIWEIQAEIKPVSCTSTVFCGTLHHKLVLSLDSYDCSHFCSHFQFIRPMISAHTCQHVESSDLYQLYRCQIVSRGFH